MRDVRLAMDGAFRVDTVAVPSPIAPTPHRRLPWIAAAVALLVAAVSTYEWWRASRPVERPLTRLSVDLGPDAVRAPRDTVTLSPDGTRIVSVGRAPESGLRQLFTRRLDESSAMPIPGTVFGPSLSMPLFSPAGDWIAFLGPEDVIRKVAVQGGSTLEVARVPPSVTGASWGDDDNIVISSLVQPGLLRVPSSGGPVQMMKKVEGIKFFPHVLPGARAVLYNVAASMQATLDDLRIDVFLVETGETKTLVHVGYVPRYLPTSGSTGHLVFIRQGTLFGVPFDPKRLEIRGMPMPLLHDVGTTSLLDGGAQFTFSNGGTFVYLHRQTGANPYSISWLNSSGQITPVIAQPGENKAA